MEKINKNLAEIRAEFYRNKRFIGEGYHAPPIFELKGYDDKPNIPPRHEDRLDSEQENKEPEPEQERRQPEPPRPPTAETTGTPPGDAEKPGQPEE